MKTRRGARVWVGGGGQYEAKGAYPKRKDSNKDKEFLGLYKEEKFTRIGRLKGWNLDQFCEIGVCHKERRGEKKFGERT